ncbi:hypothetical protein CWATWH0402_6335 [Crocosphaera watsonii WH 0402]|uniref:Uncharacterized protein n=2 Tax=Crocosphaera watsonii TaxID=263511 RepID=T2JRK5_CROWT|nr:hypothetical protein CWATWH0005_476 [Crocosphaera watsonii WH 0005]CCQ67835.1 hypothetical protein CWATWH0402_6335 [Crocosphaera watsonii WH 0402]
MYTTTIGLEQWLNLSPPPVLIPAPYVLTPVEIVESSMTSSSVMTTY